MKSGSDDLAKFEVVTLAQHILKECPRLHLRGLMTIGSIEQSKSVEGGPNEDFERLVETASVLEGILKEEFVDGSAWGGPGGKLELSMGMSSDFQQAIESGAGTVRVGTGIFGARKLKEESK